MAAEVHLQGLGLSHIAGAKVDAVGGQADCRQVQVSLEWHRLHTPGGGDNLNLCQGPSSSSPSSDSDFLPLTPGRCCCCSRSEGPAGTAASFGFSGTERASHQVGVPLPPGLRDPGGTECSRRPLSPVGQVAGKRRHHEAHQND